MLKFIFHLNLQYEFDGSHNKLYNWCETISASQPNLSEQHQQHPKSLVHPPVRFWSSLGVTRKSKKNRFVSVEVDVGDIFCLFWDIPYFWQTLQTTLPSFLTSLHVDPPLLRYEAQIVSRKNVENNSNKSKSELRAHRGLVD